MKLRMELEAPDVREMISSYFERNGFRVKNLDELCEAFIGVYPDGIGIDVDVMATNTTSPPPPPPIFVTEATTDQEPPSSKPVKRSKQNPRLSASDIMDPTGSNRPPSRDELLAQRDMEMEHILKQNASLQGDDADV